VSGQVRAGVSVAWGPLLLVITVQLLAKVDQVHMAGQDAVHATLRNYYQFMNPLHSKSSALETTSAVEISARFSYRNLVTNVLAGWCRGNVVHLYLGGGRFEFQHGHFLT
jgi:hypothetical protein